MSAKQRLLLLAVCLGALVGFCAGWVVRAGSYPSPEAHARAATQHLRELYRSMTR